MLIKNEDLYDLLNVKVGDKIRIINGGGYATGHRFEIVDNGNFMNGHCNNTHGLSRLIGVEFEKVDIKLFEPIAYEKAMRRMANEEETYIKYNGKYLECKIEDGLKRIYMYNNNKRYINLIDFIKALDYEFYVLM